MILMNVRGEEDILMKTRLLMHRDDLGESGKSELALCSRVEEYKVASGRVSHA